MNTEVINMKAKRGLCIFLSAVMIAATFAACSKKGTSGKETPTESGSAAEAWEYVTDKNGETVTDENGDKVTTLVSAGEKNDKSEAKSGSKADKATEADKKTSSAQLDINDISVPDISDIENVEITAKKEDLMPEGKKVSKKTTLRDDVIIKAAKNGNFTMKMNIVSGSNKTPATFVVSGDKISAEMTTGGATVRLLVMNGKTYAVVPQYKWYMELSEDTIGESYKDISSLGTNLSETQTYVKTTKVKDGGKEYTCEEYKNESGSTTKYYFDGNKFKKMEVIDGDEILVYDIESFTGNADSSVFSLKGYTDVTSLLNSAMATTAAKKK